MNRNVAKELLHIEGWLDRSAEIVSRGKDAYFADALLQEAGDSSLGLDVIAPGVADAG